MNVLVRVREEFQQMYTRIFLLENSNYEIIGNL